MISAQRRPKRPADPVACRAPPWLTTSPRSRSSTGSPRSSPGSARAGSSRCPRCCRRFRRASSPRRSGSSRRGWRWRRSIFAAGRSRRSPTRRGSTATSRPVRCSDSPSRSTAATTRRSPTRAGRRAVARSSIELLDCLGPMLPVEEFDSPEALAERFELLRGPGAPPGRFHGVPVPEIVRGAGVPGESLAAMLHVPAVAPFFADHFPRRPVFPATLLLDAQIGLALQLAAQAPDLPAGTQPAPVRMTHVKMRSFIAPGEVLALDAQRAPPAAAQARSCSARARTARPSPPRGSNTRRGGSRDGPAARRDHRHRARHAGRQRRRHDVGRAARRQQRRGSDQPLRRERLSGAHRRRSEGLPRRRRR